MGLFKSISVVFVAFLCLSSQATGIKDFDFFYYVLTWPASYCYQTEAGCCLPNTGAPELDFFVRGLWTYDSTTGAAVTNCKKSSFNINEISDLIEELNSYWTTVKCPSSNGRAIWESTWKTYGVCSNLSQYDYFKKALELRAKIDMLSLFKDNGIVPSGEDFYKLDKIKKVIEDNLGVSVAIQCSKNMWDEWQLYQIYVCVDKDASTIISCPVSPNFTCGEEVTFGLFTYDMLNLVPNRNPIKMYLDKNLRM